MAEGRKNQYYSLANIVINIVSNLLIVMLLVRGYGADYYAVFVLAQSLLVYIESLNMGLYTSNRVEPSLRGEDGAAFTKKSLMVSCVCSASLLLVASVLIGLWPDLLGGLLASDASDGQLALAGVVFPMVIIYGLIKIPLTIPLSAFSGNNYVYIEKNYLSALAAIRVLAAGISVMLALPLYMFYVMFFSASIAVHMFSFFHFKNRVLLGAKSCKVPAREIFGKSLRFFVTGFAAAVVWASDNFLVAFLDGLDSVSKYSVTFALFNAAYLFITVTGGILIAHFGALVREGDLGRLSDKINLSISGSWVTACAVAVGGGLFARDIIGVWTGVEHYAGLPLALIFSLYGLFLAFSSVLTSVVSLVRGGAVIIGMAVLEAVLNVPLSILFYGLLGLPGIALGTVVALVLGIVIPGMVIAVKTCRGHSVIRPQYMLVTFAIVMVPMWGLMFYYSEGMSFFAKVFLMTAVCGVLLLITYAFHSPLYKLLLGEVSVLARFFGSRKG